MKEQCIQYIGDTGEEAPLNVYQQIKIGSGCSLGCVLTAAVNLGVQHKNIIKHQHQLQY